MNPQTPTSFGLTAADLAAYDWQAVLETSTKRECHMICGAFAAKAESLTQSGDARGANVFHFLTTLAAFRPDYDNKLHPYGQVNAQLGTGKKLTYPQEIADSDMAAISASLAQIRDHEFRARVADLLWVHHKDYKAVQTAVDAYIESSKTIEDGDMWPPFAERLQRALQLGAQIGWDKPTHVKAIEVIEGAITRHEKTDNGFLCASLMELLHADEAGDAKKYAALSQQLAERAEAASLWDIALGYWQAKKAWDLRRKDQAGAAAAALNIAATYGKKAEAATQGQNASFMSAAHWMAKTLEALRSAQAPAEEIAQAHRLLLDYEQKSMAEMTTIQVSADRIPGLPEKLQAAAEEAVHIVANTSFEEAMLRLARITSPSNTAELRKRADGPQGVFTQLFGSSTVRPGGQVSDTAPPISTEDPQLHEEAVQKQMYSLARTVDWRLRVATFIEPARRKILQEHPAHFHDLQFLVEHNPFVPSGREALFLRGLHAGLHGDWVLATHLLIPQLENAIRRIFDVKGIITSKVESDGTQDERDLGWLLTHESMAKIFGADMAFDLRGLLVERFGLNIRNDLSHGLLDQAQMSTEGTVYIWWLILRLCAIPILNHQAQQAAHKTTKTQ